MNTVKAHRGFLLAAGSLAIVARLWVGLTLLSGGSASFVLASDDGDAYDAIARWRAFGAPIALSQRMAQKWHLVSDEPAEIEARWPPAYWRLLATAYRTFGAGGSGSALLAMVTLQALLGAGGVLAGYALARRVLSERTAQVATVGMAVSSTSVYLGAALYAEAVYIPLLLGALALTALAADTRRAHWPAVCAGALFGFAEATRPVALACAAVAVGWLAWRQPRAVPAIAAGFLASVAPFAAHDVLISGHLLFATAGGAEAFGDMTGAGGSLLERAAVLFVGGWAPLGEPTGLGSIANAVLRVAEALLALCGGVALWRRPSVRPILWLLTASVAAVLVPVLLVGLPLTRYRAPADPLLIVGMVAAMEAAVAAARYALAHASRSPRHVLTRGVSR